MIVGVSGFSGSGKDSVADVLCSNHGFVKMGLADVIKRICFSVFDFTEEQLWGPSSARNQPDTRYPRGNGEYLTPRYALQTLGTEWGRDCFQDVWVQYTIRLATELLAAKGNGYSQITGLVSAPDATPISGVVVPDCRFQNEFRLLRASGAKLVRVSRTGLETPPYDHPSETEQLGTPDEYFDHVFRNDGSVQDIPEKTAAMLRSFTTS